MRWQKLPVMTKQKLMPSLFRKWPIALKLKKIKYFVRGYEKVDKKDLEKAHAIIHKLIEESDLEMGDIKEDKIIYKFVKKE